MAKIMSAQAAREGTKNQEQVDRIDADWYLELFNKSIFYQQQYGFYDYTSEGTKTTAGVIDMVTADLKAAGYDVYCDFVGDAEDAKGTRWGNFRISWHPPKEQSDDKAPKDLIKMALEAGNHHQYNKNVENIDNKYLYAVVAPFRGNGEPKLILHEMDIHGNGSVSFGIGDTWVIDTSAVMRYDRQDPDDVPDGSVNE